MPTVNLTQRSVAALAAPDPSGRQIVHFDSDLKGFGVLVSGKTSAKSYIVQRDIGGKTRRITIAPINLIKLEEARKRGAELLLKMVQGIDPKAERKAEAAKLVTLRQAANAYFAARP
jgi:Arm DNA-binding domain